MEGPWLIVVQQTTGCYALALPDPFFKSHGHWHGRQVMVTGDAFPQPDDSSPGTASYSYEVDGMKVRTNLCPAALTVDEIRDLNGVVLWRKK